MPSKISRRKFLGTVSLSAGVIVTPGTSQQLDKLMPTTQTNRPVNVATVSTANIFAKDTAGMIEKVLSVMDEIIPYKPDIICLPEIFAYANIEDNRYKLRDVAEKVPGSTVSPFQRFAQENHCYVICPTYSLYKGDIYIAAVLIDRTGKIAGEYHKMRPAESELENGY